MRVRVHAWVSGRVQGVCFRGFIERRALSLALTGWVRNLGSGSVEVVAEGEREAVEHLLDALRAGPPAARVEGVEVRWEEAAGGLGPFRIVRSAY